MRFITVLFLFMSCLTAWAQEIVIVDKESGEPISHVAVFNKDFSKNLLSNLQGEANLAQFSEEEIIFFSHLSHREFHATKRQILQQGNRVNLEPSQNELSEVVLSVSHFEQERKNIPQKVISLDREDIINTNAQTSADLLESTGQVYVQKSQLGGGSPMIRGFATNRLLITVDGVRMNTAIFRGGNLQNVISIDPLFVERIEVILGPGTNIYGSDAIGGVMNFYTLTPKFSSTEGGDISGNIYGRYATANEEKTTHANFAYGNKKWAFLTAATYSDYGDLKMGSHGPDEYLRPEYVIRQNGQDVTVKNEHPKVQVPTGYDQINLMQKIRFKPTEDYDLSLGLLYSSTSNFARYDRLYRKKDGKMKSAEWFYGPQEWLQAKFQLNKAGNGDIYDNAKITAAYQYFEESRNDRNFRKEILFGTKEQLDAYSLNLDFEKRLFGTRLFYGAEYVLNTLNSHGTETNIVSGEANPGTSRYPDDATWQSLAAYGNIQWELNEELTLQTGARYNYIILNAQFDKAVYDFPFEDANLNTGALTGSAGLNWRPNPIVGWQLNLSSAFRAPNIDDVGKIFDSAPGLVVVPNPNLKPETAYNAELGVHLNFENILILDLATYYTYLDNALVRRDFELNGKTIIDYHGEPSNVQAIQNAAHARVYGFEAGARLQLHENLKFITQISYTDGEEEQNDGSKAPLRHAAPLFGNVHLVWSKNKWYFDLFGEYNAEVNYEDMAPSEKGKEYLYAVDKDGNPYSPEWYTLNFNSRYQLSSAWRLTAAVENITDQRYRSYSSGITAAGRNFIFGVLYEF